MLRNYTLDMEQAESSAVRIKNLLSNSDDYVCGPPWPKVLQNSMKEAAGLKDIYLVAWLSTSKTICLCAKVRPLFFLASREFQGCLFYYNVRDVSDWCIWDPLLNRLSCPTRFPSSQKNSACKIRLLGRLCTLMPVRGQNPKGIGLVFARWFGSCFRSSFSKRIIWQRQQCLKIIVGIEVTPRKLLFICTFIRSGFSQAEHALYHITRTGQIW